MRFIVLATALACGSCSTGSRELAPAESSNPALPEPGEYSLVLSPNIDPALPNAVRLSPVTEEASGYVYGEVSPGLPPGHLFSKMSYWVVSPDGALHIRWSNGYSGIHVELRREGAAWSGKAWRHWDFRAPEAPVVARLERVGA